MFKKWKYPFILHVLILGLYIHRELKNDDCFFESRALFRLTQNSKFFHSLSITSIFGHMYGALNVGKKNN